MKTNLYTLLLFFSVFISAISQILLKKSAAESHKSFIFEYLNKKVILAYTFFFCAVILDLLALKFVPASFVPIIETSSYVFIIVLSRIILKEQISLQQIFAMLCIMVGIFVYVA